MTHPFTDKAAEEFRMEDGQTSNRLASMPNTAAPTFLPDEPPFALCERTVRACIEALPDCVGEDSSGNPSYESDPRHALESLLPKPDRAKELVEEFARVEDVHEAGEIWILDKFVSWLISTKKLQP